MKLLFFELKISYHILNIITICYKYNIHFLEDNYMFRIYNVYTINTRTFIISFIQKTYVKDYYLHKLAHITSYLRKNIVSLTFFFFGIDIISMI